MNADLFYALEQPLHSLPAHSQVRSANLQNFADLVARLGGNPRALLERHGLDTRLIEDQDSFIDCQALVNMYEDCAADLSEPLFGFHLAEMQAPDVYGCVAALCRAAPSVREAVNSLIDYIPVVHSSESVLELVTASKVAELRWTERSNMGVNDQANCQGLLLNLKVLRMAGGDNFKPEYVTLPAEIYRNMTPEIERVIACPVRMSDGKGRIAFAADLLDARVPSANKPLFQLLSSYMSRLKPLPKRDFLDLVNDYIANAFERGELHVEGCASALGMSSRTLQSRLQSKDLSFSELLEHRRLARAKYVLSQSDMSIAELADSLGYAERTSFGRAFKRWTSLSPQQYRELHCR
ncbi:AraC family transcriptional regulator ligand-binding domain-containing protein [Zhongshania sp.]|uniref:AraC family transcriptional regulator n=1 Tax=Zhongshania sp. TaxID=1971902 RepID=UPI0035660B0D